MQICMRYTISKKMDYLPGQFQAKEVMKLLHIKNSVSERAKNGSVIQSRYRIVVSGERTGRSVSWAEEWDKARLKILRQKRN